MEMDKWDKAKWAQCTKSNRVLVGTAEVFRQNLVDRTFLDVAQISLCIFDECHHAVGNAPMANIMRDALSTYPAALRPRIVGLTASFVNGKCDNLISKRHDLEALLQASMCVPLVHPHTSTFMRTRTRMHSHEDTHARAHTHTHTNTHMA